MITYADALAIVLERAVREMPVETVPLVLAGGRTLAAAVVAGENIPPAANSAMDGYAVRAKDLAAAEAGNPARLRVIGEAAAGGPFAGIVGPGEAVRIMTGGIVPDGADGIIEIEATAEADGMVDVRRSIRRGEAIRSAGEDIRIGAEALPAGRIVTPSDIGVLASLGVVNVPVRVRPKIAILSTGNEVIPAHRAPALGEIRNSSGPALYAFCTEAGAEPIDLGIAGDSDEAIEDRIEEGLRYDILLTTGGVSAGAYDLVQQVLPRMGVTVHVHKVRIRPGKPLLFGDMGPVEHRTLVFGLPGNPVSTLVTFRQFVAPAIRRLLRADHAPARVAATLSVPIKKHDDKRYFIRGVLATDEAGNATVATTGTQSSGALSSMSRANCLIILDEATQSLAAGDRVIVELL